MTLYNFYNWVKKCTRQESNTRPSGLDHQWSAYWATCTDNWPTHFFNQKTLLTIATDLPSRQLNRIYSRCGVFCQRSWLIGSAKDLGYLRLSQRSWDWFPAWTLFHSVRNFSIRMLSLIISLIELEIIKCIYVPIVLENFITCDIFCWTVSTRQTRGQKGFPREKRCRKIVSPSSWTGKALAI